MWSKYRRLAGLSLFVGIPGFVLGAEAVAGPEYDLSIYYLSQFFGGLIYDERLSNGFEKGLFYQITQFTLQVALVAALVVASMTIFLSTLRGSHEGSFMGKGASSLLAPLRMGAGVGLLIPTSTGYASIQHVFMWFIIKGIFLANSMWHVVEQSYLGVLDSPNEQMQINPLANKLAISVCKLAGALRLAQHYDIQNKDFMITEQGNLKLLIESNPQYPQEEIIGKLPLDLTQLKDDAPDKLELVLDFFKVTIESIARTPIVELDYEKDFDHVATSGDTEYPFVNIKYNVDTTRAIFDELALSIESFWDGLFPPPPVVRSASDPDKFKQGWLSAGTRYWDVLSKGHEAPTSTALRTYCKSNCTISEEDLFKDYVGVFNESKIQSKLAYQKLLNNYFNKYWQYYSGQKSPEVIGDSFYENLMNSLGGNRFLGELLLPSQVFNFHLDASMGSDIIGSDDRLQILIGNNLNILTTITIAVVSLTLGVMAMAGISFIGKGIVSAMATAMWLVIYVVLVNILVFLIVVPPAMLGSVYLSLVPAMIYFAAALAWFIRVIEVMLVAPIISVGLMLPGKDEFGALRTVFQQLVVAIFKPSLMVIGLVIASKLVNVAFIMIAMVLSTTLEALLNAFDGGIIDIFFLMGMIFSFSMSIIVSIVTRAFGAIYLVPDQVFIAIGIQSEAGNESQELVASLEEESQKGAKMFSETIQGLTNLAQQKGSTAFFNKGKK